MEIVATDSPDAYTTKLDSFVLPGGADLFDIEVFTPSQWQAISCCGISPLFIGSSSKYDFGLSEAQDIEDTSNVSATEILSDLPTIYSTFKVQ